MTKPLVIDSVPADRLERLMRVGQIVPPDALDHMAEKMGPDSPPAAVKAKIEELSPPHLKPIVVLDTQEDSLVLMWARKDDASAEEAEEDQAEISGP